MSCWKSVGRDERRVHVQLRRKQLDVMMIGSRPNRVGLAAQWSIHI